MTGTLTRMLAPVDAPAFGADYFGQRCLHVPGASDRWTDVLTLAGFEELVLTLTSPVERRWIQLVRQGTPLPVNALALDQRGMLPGWIVFERFAQGFSIVLNHVQRRSATVARLCQSLETDLVAATGIRLRGEAFANAYLSPAGNQAFRAHVDAEEVFVLQLSGRKRWGLWPRYAAAPVRSEQQAPVDAGNPAEELVLGGGDVLYIPGGVPHAARTLADEHSLHLTIGINPVTAADVLSAQIDRSATLGTRVIDATDDIALKVEAERARRIKEEMHERALASVSVAGGVLERLVRPPVEGDRVTLVAGGRCTIADDERGSVVVVVRGCRREFEGSAGDALRCLARDGSMTVGALLTPALAATLIACGIAEGVAARECVSA